ncbi:transporter [Acidisoma silvae]|uniref:Transporter n=1 Tax=Acidisoma silvae TaxID=2802396 RepID=A0A964DZB3_9PROT|nr:transporter [Acidisoma silvae]MCB8875942.1 transporter [Acidisoma silvae]
MADKVGERGLVCGYSIDAGGNMNALAEADIDRSVTSTDALVWLHFDHADPGARAWIAQCAEIPDQAKTVLLSADSHMRIEAVGAGLCGVIGDLHHEFATQSEQLDVLRLYLDNHRLISVRHRPLAAIEKLRRTVSEGLHDGRPVVLVVKFLHHVTDTLSDLILSLVDSVDEVEDAILDGKATGHSEELGRIRRLGARLRRHMVPQQHALLNLLSRLPSWIDGPDAAKLRNAIEALGALGHDLDLVQERARLLQEQASNRLMEATNRNLYILSIVTAVFLPITLITGMFGMNLGGLPWLQSHYGFWYGVALMGCTVLVTFGLLRKGKIL